MAEEAEIAHDVKVAAKMLDARKPGWFRRIVWKRLDMCDACECIAGQSGLHWGELDDEFEARYPSSMTAPFADQAAVPAWQDEVRARRAANR